jgi:hypothetical protein
MAFRTASTFTVAATDTPQPLFGSWVTAVSPANGFAQPSSSALTLTLGTATSSGADANQIFTPGEPAWLIDPNGAHGEEVRIAAVLNNTVTLGPKTITTLLNTYPFTEYPHVAGSIGIGTFIMPKQMVNNFLVDLEDGGTGTFLYLGNAFNMTAVYRRYYKLAKVAAGVQPYFFNAGEFSQGNPIDISESWVYGTGGDSWNVSIMID